jgi:hypothetical protein
MQTFQLNPRAGMVGPLFMGQGGLLMEAGSLIFRNGRPANYGRLTQPFPLALSMRKADYVSAACVVMEKATYQKAGGFDPRVSQGDTDCCGGVPGRISRVACQPGGMAT